MVPPFFPRRSARLRALLGVLAVAFFATACASLTNVPEGFVPDEQVVYLKQRVEYGPIAYAPQETQPYDWTVEVSVDPADPSFLRRRTVFADLLTADLAADAQLFEEVKQHLGYVAASDGYLEALMLLDEHVFVEPERRSPVRGAQTQVFRNGVEYEYPPLAGAQILVFDNGNYRITLADGGTYYDNGDHYFENDARGNERYAVFPDADQFRVTENRNTFIASGDDSVVEGPWGRLQTSPEPEPQHRYEPAGVAGAYTFFTDGSDIRQYSMHLPGGIRFDYLTEDDSVMATTGDEAVVIRSNYQKSHNRFDRATRSATDILAYYFPEGIRIVGVDQALTFSEIQPAWPENYLEQTIGEFRFFYTEADSELLSRIDPATMAEITAFLNRSLGVEWVSERAVILPPDLESYRKLHAGDEPETLAWYPSGFQTKDKIVMWPPSVPRYSTEQGQEYFWTTEFPEILLHELVHVVVGQITGVFSPVPVWLNEGLAVYVESEYSPQTRQYWETTYLGLEALGELHSWDDVTVSSTSEYPVAAARAHYAQSYAMVRYLVETYGMSTLIDYVRTFRTALEVEPVDLATRYRENFHEIYGIEWSENVLRFEQAGDE